MNAAVGWHCGETPLLDTPAAKESTPEKDESKDCPE